MKNFIQRGDMITVTAPTGGVTSGQGLLVGNLFGVAATTAAEGDSVEMATVGVYELPKLASAVIATGARIAWDDTAKQVVLPAPAWRRSGSQRWRLAMASARCAFGSTAWQRQRRNSLRGRYQGPLNRKRNANFSRWMKVSCGACCACSDGGGACGGADVGIATGAGTT